MLNVHDLERRHKVYKLKVLLPYIVIFVSLVVILIVILFVNNSDMFKSNEVKHNQEIIQKHIEQTKHIVLEEVVEKNETLQAIPNKQELKEVKVDETIVLVPSLNFIANIKHSSTSSDVNYERVINKKDQTKEITKTEAKQKIALKPAKKEPEPVIIEEIELQRDNPLKIHRQNTDDDINHVIKRFSKNNNPALSLFIAKKYYEMQDYHQSYNYALITNRINDNIDSSWIIFAKSLVKLNRKQEAVETLKRYIEHSKSSQAKTLLEEIERGKFK